ncbi:coiled-coil-helix-coiled-coil-helix domain-containing protein 5 [Patagioenas fasciata monilis]|uniref:Coiled-coil-helix-coiled-coil-helix domain-containing protein 5 n=1 Tax=Patagioenas fasciata monilis TaxID=372326 RepID=A0A1V4KDT8_PATFA|nr:coiled-coil-helix-coiled-coil-helix domain-containing protein 5 [Patagioenas fasciata monilis]
MRAAVRRKPRSCTAETARTYGGVLPAACRRLWRSRRRDCHGLRLSISRCAAAHPIVQQIRRDCAGPFAAFEQCLKENEATVTNCSDHVNAFLLCADRVKGSA